MNVNANMNTMNTIPNDHRASLARSLSTIHRIMYDSDCTDDSIERCCNKNNIRTKSRLRLAGAHPAPSFTNKQDRTSKILKRQRSNMMNQAWDIRDEKYSLGDTLRCSSDMIVAPTPDLAIEAASLLQKDDFAFVKRRDGSYTYARLIACSEDHLIFVVCKMGSTKRVGRKHIPNIVRFVAPEVSDARLPSVPRFISVVSGGEDDCSRISDAFFVKH